jgi:hypothetical protein
MSNQLLNSKINKAINEAYPMYFVRTGLHGLELRAVSYTYENGKDKSRKLDEFDIKVEDDLYRAITIYLELRKRLPIVLAPDIVTALDGAFWSGVLPRPINVIIDSIIADDVTGIVASSQQDVKS